MFDVTLVVAGQQQHDGGGGEEGSGSSPSVRMRSSTVVLRRDWQELRALHLALTELLSSSAANKNGSGEGDSTEVTLPPLPQYAGADTTDAEMAEQVALYLRQLLELPAVTTSRPFLGLLNDHDGAGGAESSGTVPENAVDFLLQPCAFTSTYVARRAQHRMEADVPQGSTVLWRFSVGDGLDIQFSAVFTPACSVAAEEAGAKAAGPEPEEEERQQKGSRVVLMEGRFPPTAAVAAPGAEKEAGPGVVQGSFTAPTAGSCVFTWDNAFSRLRGKQVQHAVEVVAPEAMQAAVEAAAELARASSRNRSLITALIKEGKGTGGAIRVEVTPVARPAGASAVGGGGSGPGVDGETEGGDMGGELTVEEERLIASGRGGLGALLSLSSFSSSGGSGGGGAMLRPSASISSLPSLDASASGAGADEQGAAARRSSLGLIWGYLSRGKEDGSGGNGEQPQQQQQGAQAGGEAGPLRADVEHVVAMVERLEDELAHMTVKKEQAEAEAVIALAKQRRWSIEKERFERRMNEALARGEQLGEQIQVLEAEKEALRGEVAAKQQAVEAREEAAKRAERERDVLQAEKHVWTVAHSGAQAELTNLSAALERERQAHEDTRAAWRKAKEMAHKAKAEAEGLRARLDVKGDERALQAAQEELANARAEVRDLTDAVEETAAENETLKGQVKLLARHVKQQKQEMAVLQTEAGHLRMRASAQEKVLAQLKAERKLLVKELRTAFAQQQQQLQHQQQLQEQQQQQVQEQQQQQPVAASPPLVAAPHQGQNPPGQEQEDSSDYSSGSGSGSGTSGAVMAREVNTPPRPSSKQEQKQERGEEQEYKHEPASTPSPPRQQEDGETDDGIWDDRPDSYRDHEKETADGPSPPDELQQPQQQHVSPPPPPPPSPSEATASTAPTTPAPSSPALSSAPASASASADSSPKAAAAAVAAAVNGDVLSPRAAAAAAVHQQQHQQHQQHQHQQGDPRYQRLLNQLTSAQERRKQLLLLLEEDPANEHVKQLASDLDGVLASLKRRMRLLLEAGEGAAGGGGGGGGGGGR